MTEPEYYEVRCYEVRNGRQAQRLQRFLQQAAIPAWNRAGLKPVGAFAALLGGEAPHVHVLLRYASLAAMLAVKAALGADRQYAAAGREFLETAPEDPGFIRIQSSLVRSTAAVPTIEAPRDAADRPRIFELRRYECPSEHALAKKLEMFANGEMAIFRRCGLQPIFFGETLVGPRLPSLVYMLTFDSLAALEQRWAAFRADPEWQRLWTTPGYTDAEIVSNTHAIVLRPLPGSQI